MTKKNFWNVIGIDDKEMILAIHSYTKVVAKWLEVLASYAGQPNLTVIMSRIILEQLKAWRVALNLR